MPGVDHLLIDGPTLACWITSALAGERMCDGLLFGAVEHHARTHTNDEAEARTVSETDLTITGSLCCCSTGSFYDAAGVVDGQALEQLIADAPDPLVGWFCYRGPLDLHPSMREARVCASLQQWLAARARDAAAPAPAQPPVVLLGLLGSSLDHGGATTGMVVRMFQPSQQQPRPHDGAGGAGPRTPHSPEVGTLALEPLALRTLNLAASLGHHAAGDWGGSGAAFSAAMGMLPSSSSEQLTQQLAAIAAAATTAHVKGVEAAYEALLGQLRREVAGLDEAGSAADEEELARLQERATGALLKLQQQVQGCGS